MVFGRPFACPAPPVNGARYFRAIAPLTDTRQTFRVIVSCPVLSLPVSVQVRCLPQVRRSFPFTCSPASICLLAERHPRFHYCVGGGPSPRAIEDTPASSAFPKGSPCCCPCAFPDWSLVHWPFLGRPALSCRIRYNETFAALPLVHWSSEDLFHAPPVPAKGAYPLVDGHPPTFPYIY